MKTWITRFDEELLENSRRFLGAADANPQSRAPRSSSSSFTEAERERGRTLIRATERSFEWERAGTAWNFLSPTPERRRAEAIHWFKDGRRRYLRDCVRAAESAHGVRAIVEQVAKALSPFAYLEERAQFKRNLARAAGEKPADAPPPKDTALVELAGWYEHWRLLAQRVFRQRPDLMAPYGLKPGKAPPRLRGKEAKLKYGERAAGPALTGDATAKAGTVGQDGHDGDDEDEVDDVIKKAAAPEPRVPANGTPKALPVIQ